MPPLRKLMTCGLGLFLLSSQTGGAAKDSSTHFIIESSGVHVSIDHTLS